MDTMETEPGAFEAEFSALEAALDAARAGGNSLGKALSLATSLQAHLPGDADLLCAKASVLLHLERYEEALAELPDQARVLLERAYCLYRTGRLSESLTVLAKRGEEGGREACAAQLSAQLLYRTGRSQEAVDVYERAHAAGLLDSEEARTNVVAAYVAARRSAEVPQLVARLGLEPSESVVASFNVACASLDCGRLEEAAAHLATAMRLVEEEAEEEGEEAALPLRVQQAYLATLLGETREAAAAHASLAHARPSDLEHHAVLSCNLVAGRRGAELFDSLKRVEKLLERTPELASRLSPEQLLALQLNWFALLLLAHKTEAAAEEARKLAELHAGEPRLALLQACVLLAREKGKPGLESAEALLAAAGEDARITMLRAQLAVDAGDLASASSLLALPSLKPCNRLLATRIALHEARGEVGEAEALIDAAVSARGGEAELHAAARFKAIAGRPEESVALYQRLVSGAAGAEERSRALRGLVGALAETDLAAAEALADQLQPRHGAGADAEELDFAGCGAALESGAIGAAGEGAAGIAAGEKAPKRRARKPRYPAGFDPAAPNNPPPDPERWLPRRERTQKGSRKKARAAQLRGPQGAQIRS